jgi:hypothetical protein
MNRETFVGRATIHFELLVTVAALAGLVAVAISAGTTSSFVLLTAIGIGLMLGVATGRSRTKAASTRSLDAGAALFVVAFGWWVVGTTPWLVATIAWVLIGRLAVAGLGIGRRRNRAGHVERA